MISRKIKMQKNIYNNERFNIPKLKMKDRTLEQHTECQEEK